MDDNMFDGLESNGQEFPELESNQVWAAKLEITVVKFPSPQHADVFFKMVTGLIAKLCEALHMDVIESTTALGIATRKDDIGFNKPDISKYKN